ncbi:MAG: hypothetical protein PHX53_02250 [Syntrophales bacterium]|nr:hypothetical protein [Syntrophales bacterium]
MKKAIAVFILGIVCLFLFSVTYGVKVFSAWERRSQAEKRLENQHASGSVGPAVRESRGKKIRLSMNSFDLANGLTFQELDDIRHDPNSRLSAFLLLLTSLWLAWGLRWSKGRP